MDTVEWICSPLNSVPLIIIFNISCVRIITLNSISIVLYEMVSLFYVSVIIIIKSDSL